MGCCKSKEAVVEQRDDEDAFADDSPASPVAAAAPKAKKTAASKRKKGAVAASAESSSQPAAKPSAPSAPAGSVPIQKGEKPPPGWGGTPEVEEPEEEVEEGPKGPRALKNIPGGNGYISGTRKDQEISEGVMDRIRGLEDAGLRTKKENGLENAHSENHYRRKGNLGQRREHHSVHDALCGRTRWQKIHKERNGLHCRWGTRPPGTRIGVNNGNAVGDRGPFQRSKTRHFVVLWRGSTTHFRFVFALTQHPTVG